MSENLDKNIVKKTIVPEKIPVGQQRPTKEVEGHNKHVALFVDQQKASANNAKKAFDIFEWRLNDMHKCMNPKNQGKYEKVKIENPEFDQNKKICEKTNPFFIEVYRSVYEPDRFKENTVNATLAQAVKKHDDIIGMMQQKEKELKQELKAAKKEAAEKGLSVEESSQSEGFTPLIELDFDGSGTVQ